MERCICFLIVAIFFMACDNKDNTYESINYRDTSTYLTTDTFVNDNISVYINEKEYIVPQYKLFPPSKNLAAFYRIPSAVLTKAGTLLVSCENREKREDRGEIDILVARCTEYANGFEIRRVFDYNKEQGRSMNPVFWMDEGNGRIYLFTCHLKDKTKFARDHSTDEIDFVYKYSDDDGRSWSDEFSLKEKWNTDLYTAAIPSSVKGISLRDNTMLLPVMFIKNHDWYSGLLIRKSNKWYFSSMTPNIGDNECTVYLDINNKIVLECRTYEKTRRRYYYDLENDTFELTTSPNNQYDIAISAEVVNDNGTYYMCYPGSSDIHRSDLTLYGSFDSVNWKPIFQIMHGSTQDFGYSTLAIDRKQMFIAYETGEGIFVQDLSFIRNNTEFLNDIWK